MTQDILRLHHVTRQIGSAQIICGIDLQVRAGEKLALIGPNGAGKSTLFNLISGRDQASSGQIYLHDQLISGLTPFQIARRGLARSFQTSNIFSDLSVFDNLSCAVMWSKGIRYNFWRRFSHLRDTHRSAEKILDLIALSDKRDHPAGQLSYAEQRVLEIGMTVANDASCILLDEPSAGMSRSETSAVIALIRKLSEGKTLLMVEHDMSVVFQLADRIAVMAQGKLIACDTPEKIRDHAQVREAYLGSSVDLLAATSDEVVA